MRSNQVKSINSVLIWPTLIILSLSLSACGTPVKKIEVLSTPLERVPLNLPKVDELNLDTVDWILVTPENAEKVWKDLEKKKFDIVLFGLTDRGYEDLSVNIAKIKQMVIQQKSVIAAYKKYYESQTEEIEKQQKAVEEKKKEAALENEKAEEENKKGFLNKLNSNVKGIFK
tara:strand:- start:654 stop:1169 length:516 start_codon:yes stop_codon:yes gene_type:complete